MNENEIEEKWHELLFGVRCSIRYHNYRRRFFERLSVWTDFLTIISGGAVVGFSTYAGETNQPYYHWLSVFAGGLIAILAAFDLVVGFSLRAREHYDLAKQFAELERQMIKSENNLTTKNLAACTDCRLEIEQDEPPILQVLNVYCHNEVCRAGEYPREHKVKIGFFQSLFKQLFDICPAALDKTKDLNPQAASN